MLFLKIKENEFEKGKYELIDMIKSELFDFPIGVVYDEKCANEIIAHIEEHSKLVNILHEINDLINEGKVQIENELAETIADTLSDIVKRELLSTMDSVKG